MIKKLKKFKWCFLGLHLWSYWVTANVRECDHCKKLQGGSYDMCYGGTFWEDITQNDIGEYS